MAALAVATTAGSAAAQATAQAVPPAAVAPEDLVALLAEAASPVDRGPLVRRLATLRGEAATRAAEALLALPAASSRTALAELAATLAVGEAGDPAYAPAVAKLLRDGGPEAQRRDAAIALAALGPAGAAVLVDAAAAGNTVPTQTAATIGLALLPDPQPLRALAAMLGEGYLPESRRAAAAALRELTGIDLPPGDVDAWRAWTDGALAAEDEALRLLLVEASASRRRVEAARLAQAEATLSRLARDRYAAAEPARRRELLAELMADVDPAARLAGGRIVLENIGLGELPGDRVAGLARAATSDPDPRVRRLAARLVRDGGDREGVRLVLDGLADDPDAATRLSMLRTIAPLADTTAIAPLLALAADDSYGEVRATAAATAARAAAESGQAEVVRQASRALQGLLAEAGDEASRRGVREALARLPDASLSNLWVQRLGELGPNGNAIEVATALRGLTSTADNRAADAAGPYLSHPDAAVRVAAVRALAATGGFARMSTLQPLFDPRDGASVPAAVGEAARTAFLSSLPAADGVALAAWPDRLGDPALRLAVLRELADRARTGGGGGERLAFRLHEIADLLAGPLDRPGEAAELYEEALRLELDRQEAASPRTTAASTLAPTPLAVSRVDGAMSSRLRSGDVEGARRLAAEVLGRRATLAGDVGAAVRRAADRLVAAGRRDEARAAVEAALAWQPPLDQLTRRRLDELRQRLSEGGG